MQRTRPNFNAVYKRSATEALEFLAGAPIDMLVTDLRMPEIDGLQLLEKV